MDRTVRRHRAGSSFVVRVGYACAGLLLLAAVPAGAFLDPTHPLQARLDEQVREGELSEREALLAALAAVYAPDELDADLASLNRVPSRCATPLLLAAGRPGILREEDREQVRAWTRTGLGRRSPGTIHLSSGGHFAIEYWTSGVDSVPVTDLSPMNGVPDFVDRVASEFELSWTAEFDILGFDPPETMGAPYQVELRAIGSLGTTALDGTAPGGTRITLRNDYSDAPANEDPEGSELGALRASVAHELRHAGQYATSGWSEPGLWVEVDAVWMEDQVYDQVNDYYRYLTSSSPISDPQLPLDSGGSGSYPECVLQHWMQERLGLASILDYWQRRANFPAEAVVASYDAVLTSHGMPLVESFLDFALFNLQTGTLSGPGVGYPEAESYPDARLSESATALPARFGSAIEHLAAKFYRVTGFSETDQGVRIRARQPEGLNLRMAAIVVRDDATRVVEELDASALDESFVLSTVARDVQELYVVVSNGGSSGPVEWFFVDVEEVPLALPDAVVDLDGTWNTLTLGAGQVRTLSLPLRNLGSPASELAFNARAVQPLPGQAARSIAGSTLALDRLEYIPAESCEFSVGVHHGTSNFEFIAGASITLPAGVSMVSGADIVGEGGLALTFVGIDAPTSTVSWLDLDGGFGAIPGNGTGLGRLQLGFDPALTGPLVFDWVLDGDGFGGGPHQVSGQIVLQGPVDPRLEVLMQEPVLPAVIGEELEVRWYAADPGPVSIELSRDDGQSWEVLVPSATNDGTWLWNCTGPAAGNARWRIGSGGNLSPASPAFDILEALDFATVLPPTGIVAGGGGTTLSLEVDATNLAPGFYPVRVDVRDTNSGGVGWVDVTVEVLDSPVDAPAQRRTRMLGAWPNPFNPRTELRFELGRPQAVRLDILDLRGRRIRTLLDESLPAGPHRVGWEGLDADGHAIGSGTYLYQLRTEDGEFTGKLGLVR